MKRTVSAIEGIILVLPIRMCDSFEPDEREEQLLCSVLLCLMLLRCVRVDALLNHDVSTILGIFVDIFIFGWDFTHLVCSSSNDLCKRGFSLLNERVYMSFSKFW